MKNIVFTMDIDLAGEGRYSSTRRLPYKYSIKSWEKWCSKNDSELFVLNDLLLPKDEMAICWQRYYLFDILEANDIQYDQILMVDADTIVHPDCPNFFEMTDRKMCGVHNEGSYDWIIRSIENYGKYFFNGHVMDFWKYIDCGFVIVNDTHRDFFKQVTDFYNENAEMLRQVEKEWHAGTDQTPVNILIHDRDIDFKWLPYEFNMCDMFRKELLTDDLLFTKWGWIYQYNSIPNNTEDKLTYLWMKKTYEHLYGN
tara:strand:- start:9259 stop:10023 length:765 start_codon:yes stop_codon:yes gene_type:complete